MGAITRATLEHRNTFREAHSSVPSPSSMPSNTRFALGSYIADVVQDRQDPGRVFHWIVQRVGSSEQIVKCERSGQDQTAMAQ